MKKFLLLFAAIASLNMIMPQKASAQEELNDVKVGDITYFLVDYGNDFLFAGVEDFSNDLTGHVVVPETINYLWPDHGNTWQVRAIGRVLTNMSKITSLDLPSGIYSVNHNSFSESETLNSLIIRAEVPPVVYDKDYEEVSDTDIFNKQRIVNVYVPEGSVQAYKDDSNWGKRPIFPISQYQAIDNVQSGKVQSTKVIKDGVLFIERNGKTYNAIGTQVK
jgi:hypothetical protein